MSKLLPWLVMLGALFCAIGSIAVPAPYPPAGGGYAMPQADARSGVCCAPPSLLPALYDRFPGLRQIPEFIGQSEKQLVEEWMPVVSLQPPARDGSLIDSIFVKAAPYFL